jgi:hypothetical protein
MFSSDDNLHRFVCQRDMSIYGPRSNTLCSEGYTSNYSLSLQRRYSPGWASASFKILVTTASNILSLQRPQSRDTVQAKLTFLEIMIYTTLTFNG